MQFPSNRSDWASDVFDALDSVLRDIDADGDGRSADKLEVLYLEAPKLAALRRGIDNKELIREMEDHAVEGIKEDLSLDPESKKHWLFHFVLAYVHAHAPIEIVDELALDRIMDYINDNHDLFST